MGRSKEVLRMLVPSATVSLTSACIVILELVASRLVARHLGASLYTWTGILGVALTGLALGGYLGGRIADRHHARRALAVLFGLASAACVAIIVVNNLIGDWAWLWRLSWPMHVFVHVLLVFLVPSTLLGTIGPVVVKMALDQGLPTGRTIGDIVAWAAAGSIAGTLLAGFYLISTFGSTAVIWGLGAALLVLGVLYWLSCWVLYVWAMIFGALVTMGMAPVDWAQDAGTTVFLREPPDPNVLYEADTPYSRVEVRKTSDRPDRRTIAQDKLARGEAIVGEPANLQYFYTRIWAGLTHGLLRGRPDPTLLVLGSGGYAFPRYLKATWPQGRVEVVEIDPGVTTAARAAFGLDRDSAIETIHGDARTCVDRLLQGVRDDEPAPQYDLIYADVFRDYAVPFHLVTHEFNEKVACLLAADGVYMINLIEAYDNGQLLGAVVNTVRQTFPHVHVLTSEISLPSLRDSFVVVAAKRPIDPGRFLSDYSDHLTFWLLDQSDIDYLLTQAGRLILTDDFAPVEHLLTPVVRQGATEILARRHFEEARRLQADGRCEESERHYAQAVSLNPSLSLHAYHQIGLMHAEQGRPEQAVAAFEKAIAALPPTGGKQTALGAVHMNLGMLLDRMKKPQQSREHLARAAEWFRIELAENPQSVVVWDRLGDTRAMLGDFKEAAAAFEQARALEPANPSHYQKLARALDRQERYGEAIPVVRRHIRLLQEQGKRDAAGQLGQYVEWLEYQRAKQAR